MKHTDSATDPIAPLAGATVSPPTNPTLPPKTTDSQGQVSFWGIPFEVTGDIKVQASGFNQGTIALASITKTGTAPVICTASTILFPIVPPAAGGVGGTPPGGTSATAANPQKLMSNIQKLAIGLGAFIAVIRIIFGAFKLMSEGDNPIALEEGRDMITSSILGLLVILFAVTLLKIILTNVLGIT